MRESLHRYIKSVGWLRWLFVTKEGEVAIVQYPNIPLWIALVADLVAYLTQGTTHTASNWIARIAFIVWSIMEIGWGVNPFRRMLGAVVLALVGYATVRSLM